MRRISALAAHLLTGEGHVWLIDADDPAWSGPALPRETERALRFASPADSRRWLRGRVAIRSVLFHYGAARFAAIGRDTNGAPTSPVSGLSVSISHSGSDVAIALALCPHIGVDIERIERIHDSREIVRSFFDTAEAEAMSTIDPRIYDRAFLFSWTLKEAALKASRAGLMAPLASVRAPLVVSPQKRVRLVTEPSDPWPAPPSVGRTFETKNCIGAAVGDVRWRLFHAHARRLMPIREAA